MQMDRRRCFSLYPDVTPKLAKKLPVLAVACVFASSSASVPCHLALPQPFEATEM